MSIFIETTCGDIVIDLHDTQSRQLPQMINLLELIDVKYFHKLSFFCSPQFFQDVPSHSHSFLFFGDSTYTGKGGQSFYNVLHYADPSHPWSAAKTSTEPFLSTSTSTTAAVSSSYALQQHKTKQRREFLQSLWDTSVPLPLASCSSLCPSTQESHPSSTVSMSMSMSNPQLSFPPSSLPSPSQRNILLLSIPQSNGNVTSVFALYSIQPDDTIDSFPPFLLDYIIGTVGEGFASIRSLHHCAPTTQDILQHQQSQQETKTSIAHQHHQRQFRSNTLPSPVLKSRIIQTIIIADHPYIQRTIQVPSTLSFFFPHQSLSHPTSNTIPHTPNQNLTTAEMKGNTSTNDTHDTFDHQLLMYADDFQYIPSFPLSSTSTSTSTSTLATTESFKIDPNDTPDTAAPTSMIQIHFEPPQTNTLFISNLHSDTTEQQLIQLLTPYTTVVHCQLNREKLHSDNTHSVINDPSNLNGNENGTKPLWKCYAFVDVSHVSHCDAIIKHCNGILLHKHSIRIDYCHSNSAATISTSSSLDNTMMTSSMYYQVHLSNPYFSSIGSRSSGGNKGKATLTSTILAAGGDNRR